jgi:hypothetical protein
MRKRISLTSFIFLLVTCANHAQVNLQSGAAEYSLPLYSYSDPNNRIATSVSLEYTAGGGLKVSEIPSSIGAGWALAAGGFIQRIQHGEPDDQKNYLPAYNYPSSISNPTIETNFHNWVDNYYPNGYLYSTYSPATLMDNGGGYTPTFSIANYKYKPNPKYTADLEQDIFTFNFNGRNGHFVIGKFDAATGTYPIRTLYDSKLKIVKVDGDLNNANNIRTTISEFQIIDEEGIKYIFKDADLEQVCIYDKIESYDQYGVYTGLVPFTYSSASGGGGATYYMNLNLPPKYEAVRANTKNSFVKNRWYLSEIINPLTGVKIQFTYETYNFDFQGNKTAQQTVTDNKASLTVSVERLKGVGKRLKKIIVSPKESVEFNYSSADRIDAPGDKVLENITVKYENVVRSKWELEQGYFVKNEVKALGHNFNTEEKVWARLCLQKLKKTGIGNSSEPPYIFSYYMGNENGMSSAIPPLFTYYRDFWGYYNIMQRGGFYNMANHSFNLSNPPYEPYGGNLMPKNLLESNWNAGGFYKRPTLEARNGVLKTITNPLGGVVSYSYEQNYYDAGTAFQGGIRVNKTTTYDGLDHGKDIITEYKYIKSDGSSSAWGFENNIYSASSNMRVYHICGNQRFPAVDIPQMVIGFQKYWSFYTYMKAGYAKAGLSMSEFAADYPVTPLEHSVRSAMGEIILLALVNIILDLITPAYLDYAVTEYNSDSYISHNLLPYQYSRVEVINKIASDNAGKAVYEFTSPAETDPKFAIDVPTLSSPFSSRQRYAFWLYGLPKQVTVLDKYGKIVKQTENFYEPFKYSLAGDPKFLSQKWAPNKRTYDCLFTPYNQSSTNEINHDSYYPICGRVELKYTKEYIYNPDNPLEFTMVRTDYEYSPNNYLPNKVKTTNSKGETIETNTYYPLDYTLAGVIQTMKTNNIINVPVSSQALITKAGPIKYMLSGAVSEFGTAGNGDIKVNKTHSFRSDQPIVSTTVPFSAAQLIPNTSYFKETGSVFYNSLGGAVQVNTENGKLSTIYDYDNKTAIATISNADIGEVAYTSFESDGWGGWTMIGGSTILSTDGITGRKSFSGGLQKSALPAGNYSVTLWSLISGSARVNGQQGTAILTIGMWRLLEWKLTNITSVSVEGDHIDEVRLHPIKSRMTTVTHDPLIGKTSECDASNRIIYYEYDGLGRLKVVKDENKNVIKAFEYNYKQ